MKKSLPIKPSKKSIPVDKRVNEILNHFRVMYPDPQSELNYRNEYELVVAVALSAQCTDKKVNEVTKTLFEKCPDFLSLSLAPLNVIEDAIRQVNYYKTKASNIKKMAASVCENHQGKLPLTHRELIQLNGVGNKTANVILSELRITPAFPVDTHVFRVSQRLNLAQGKTVEEIEVQLKNKFAPELWHDLHHWLIFHGRRVCKAQNPNCLSCQIQKFCPSAKLFKVKPLKQ